MPSFGASLAEALESNELRSASGDTFEAVLDRFSKDLFLREFTPVIESSLCIKEWVGKIINFLI
jgi:hypothetical protein